MKKNAKEIIKRTKKNINHISLGEFFVSYIVVTINEDETKTYEVKIVRDLSVQREGVWDLNKKMDFIAQVVTGNGDNNMLHYVDLEKCRFKAENEGSFNYMNHLAKFIKNGADLSHIDGGNRTDALIGLLTNEIPLKAGFYDYGTDDDGNRVYHTLETDTFWDNLDDDFKNTILTQGMLVTVIYEDLTQEERATLFKTLNDGVDLNSAEKRNAEVSIICEGNRELNEKYKDLFVEVNALTLKKADRWLFCEYVSKLMQTSNTYLKDGEWSWASSAQIDKDYKSGSQADLDYQESRNFFEKEFVPYMNLIKTALPKKAELYCSSAYVDFYLLLTYMKKNNIELYEKNKNTKINFLKLFNNQIISWFADITNDFYTKTTKGVKRYEKYAGITTKSMDTCINARMELLINNFVTKLLDGKTLVKVEKRTPTNKAEKASMFSKQKGKAGSTDDVIDGFTLNKEAEVDHKKPLRKGGSDTRENKILETKKYNRKKSAKDLETV